MPSELEARVMRRISFRIVPFIMLLYFIAFIDRVNIGFAALTMNKDLGFSPAVFGLGAGIFFLGYFIFEVPSNLILNKVGARLWIARVMITWGIISAAFAFISGETSFLVLRFLLGVAEAGFFPGIILYLSFWFPARYRAGVVSLFMAAAPISVVLGSPLSSALLEMDGLLGLRGWQWMFIMEAIPAFLLGFVVLSFMTDKPEKATWLKDDEREWLVNEMNAEHAAKAGTASHSIWRGLADLRVLALSLIYFGTSAGLYTLVSGLRRSSKNLACRHCKLGSLTPSHRPSPLSQWSSGPAIRTKPTSALGTSLLPASPLLRASRSQDPPDLGYRLLPRLRSSISASAPQSRPSGPCRPCSCRDLRRPPASQRSTRSATLVGFAARSIG